MCRLEAARMAASSIRQAAKAFIVWLLLMMRAFLEHVSRELVKFG